MGNKTARKKWTIGVSVAALMLLLSGYFGYQSFSVYHALDGMDQSKEELQIGKHQEDESMKPDEWTGTEPVNILLMGGDNRGLNNNDSARSDSLLSCR